MAKFCANAAIAIGLKLIEDRGHSDDDLGVVSFHRRRVVIGRAWQPHQTASFGDGDAVGPVMTDVIALLGRGAFLSAPFRNSISSACLPTMRSSAAIFASYSGRRSAAWPSSSNTPASSFLTQIRIRLR